jgi:hypothetical protein
MAYEVHLFSENPKEPGLWGISMHKGGDLSAKYEPVYSVMNGDIEDAASNRLSGKSIKSLQKVAFYADMQICLKDKSGQGSC